MENTLIYDHFKLEELSNISDLSKVISLADEIDAVYFLDYSDKRNDMLKTKIMEIIKVIDQNNSNLCNKTEISFLYFTKSLCLDKLPDYSKVAEESATKSLKLNPFNADNYNCIAHILWKKGDIDTAISYYEKALGIDQANKRTLRSLSMIVRSKVFQNVEEKKEVSKLSLDYGKKAVQIDLKDSESWCKHNIIINLDVYGNAYFFKAFADLTQYEDLKLSLGAYTKAEVLQTKHKNPDLFYNRGVVHTYLENYDEAFKDFHTAHLIDYNLKANEIADNIQSSVIQTFKFIKNKCTLKLKKLSPMLATIPKNLNENISFTLGWIENLATGENKNKLISAKIIQPISRSFEVPL